MCKYGYKPTSTNHCRADGFCTQTIELLEISDPPVVQFYREPFQKKKKIESLISRETKQQTTGRQKTKYMNLSWRCLINALAISS